MTHAAFQQFASNVLSAPEGEWLQALCAEGRALIREVRQGRLVREDVESEIARVANQLDAAGKIDETAADAVWTLLRQAKGDVELPEPEPQAAAAPAVAESEPPVFDVDQIDESESEDDPAPLSRTAREALESWERTISGADQQHRAKLFSRGAIEVYRLAKVALPAERLQIVDDLHAIGVRAGLSVDAVQTFLEVATEAPLDRRPGIASAPPAPAPADEPPIPDPDEYGHAYAVREEMSAPALALVSPPDWRDVPLPPMRWLATHRIPAADATILSGDGGGGKTTVALQLAVAVERGLGDWLGTVCESGPVIFFSAEEPQDEMRRRLERVARKRGLEPAAVVENLHFHFADPDRCLLGVTAQSGAITPTPLFSALQAAALEIRPVLIVVDSIAATFGGNQNDRVHARTFVAMFRRLAQLVDCAVLLLDHPSLSGITSGTGRGGSMDWQNATRARLHLETVQADDGTGGRVLEVKKTNYGPSGEKVRLQWEDGCFVMEGSATGQTAPHRAAAHQRVDDLFLHLLEERNAQGRWVTTSKATGYAPKELAAMPGAGDATPTAFAHAMERLLADKRITVETFGPPSKQRQRLVVAATEKELCG